MQANTSQPTPSIKLPLALLIFGFASLHFFCDAYIDTTIGHCCPQIPDRDAVTYFSPTESLCWEWSEPLSIIMVLAAGGLLVAWAVSASQLVSDSTILTSALTVLRVFGRLTALFSIGLLALVLILYTQIEFFI
ncbi:MAG: hypothetical protein AAF657_36375 [Acidobacteriota bacterium]